MEQKKSIQKSVKNAIDKLKNISSALSSWTEGDDWLTEELLDVSDDLADLCDSIMHDTFEDILTDSQSSDDEEEEEDDVKELDAELSFDTPSYEDD